VFRRPLVLLAAVGAAATAAAAPALAVRVHVRVEGKTRTLYGTTQPVLEGGANALTALDAASVAGEFYYHVQQFSFGSLVDQIGRYAPAPGEQAGWLFKVNGVLPPVGADQVSLHDGDTVLWYWAQFGVAPGGPKTLVLSRVGKQNCYRVVAQDDAGTSTAALGAVLHVGRRTVRTQGATQAAVACVGRHRGLLVRATLGGAVRSNAVP
jgi:hypothetical protein